MTQYGNRLPVNIVDGIAANDPSRPFIFVPRSSNPVHGWKPVSFGELAQAVNHLAWQITNTHGPAEPESFPTLAYIGLNDARYMVVMLACIEAGYRALFLSQRNSKEAQQSLPQRTDCRIFGIPTPLALWSSRGFATTPRRPSFPASTTCSPKPPCPFRMTGNSTKGGGIPPWCFIRAAQPASPSPSS